jgi:hypothetical protein
MATLKQIAANRENAKNSTGPNTLAGKSKSRLNAKRDGFTGQVVTLSVEDRPVFEHLKAELIADLDPRTVIELRLAHSIAWDTWRLDHLRAVEANLYALGADTPDSDLDCEHPQLHTALSHALTYANNADRFGNLSLYEQRLNRSIHKNLATLHALQAERKLIFNREMKEEVEIARANDFSGLPYQAPATPTRNGFVFANSEILAAAHRASTLEVARHTLKSAPNKVQFAGASSTPSNDALSPA